MITLENDRLEFRFPEVHKEACCSIEFQRTLRIPDDGADYLLPPGLGRFPLQHLDDHAPRLPEEWHRRGGVVIPMHQAEAMWINFESGSGYPFAVKVATGKICAITGDTLGRSPEPRPTRLCRAARTALAGRILYRPRLGPAIRGHATGGGLHRRGATYGRRKARWIANRCLPHEGGAVRRADRGSARRSVLSPSRFCL